MTKSLVNAVIATRDLISSVDGLRIVPDQPPEKIAVDLFAIVYPGPIEWVRGSSGMIKALPHIMIEVHKIRKDLARDIVKISGFGETIGRLLWSDTNITLPDTTGAATIDTIVEMTTDFGPLGYGSLETFGWLFDLKVKIW